MSLLEKRLVEIHQDLRKKEYTVSELVRESRKRIDAVDGQGKAFLRLNDAAEEQAKRLDEQLAQQEVNSVLFGIPMGVKDNIVTKGINTTCASKMLANYEPIYDATVMERLAQAQAVMMGKCNMDEFAMGSSTETSAFHPTYNPWNLDHVPGGSSGGSAAAVAAGEVVFALGSDTGGSIRQPAAYCGVVGLKPTYGLVSRFGLVGYGSSLDQIGPLTRTVEDAAYVLQAIAGHDAMDSTSANVNIPDYAAALTGDIKGVRIGVPKEYLGEGVDGEVKARIEEALRILEGLGAHVEEVSLPHVEYAVPTYYIISCAEASSNLACFDGVRYGFRAEADNVLDMFKETRGQGFGLEVKQRIILGTYVLSSGNYEEYFLKAQKVRTLIRQDFDRVYETCDVLIGPTAPTTAFKIGEKIDDSLTMYYNDMLTIPANLAGLPAISVPAGFASNGLPVGMQIIGKAFDEPTVLRVAHAFEQQTDYHTKRPAL